MESPSSTHSEGGHRDIDRDEHDEVETSLQPSTSTEGSLDSSNEDEDPSTREEEEEQEIVPDVQYFLFPTGLNEREAYVRIDVSDWLNVEWRDSIEDFYNLGDQDQQDSDQYIPRYRLDRFFELIIEDTSLIHAFANLSIEDTPLGPGSATGLPNSTEQLSALNSASSSQTKRDLFFFFL